MLFPFVAMCLAGLSGAFASFSSTTVVTPVSIGETVVNISREVFPVPSNCLACIDLNFINLHENENTSVTSVRSFLLVNGGSVVKFQKQKQTRYVSFSLDSKDYTFDPNRMFTPNGIKATLETNGPYSEAAAEEVTKFATAVLDIYGFDDQDIVLALHNNGGTYGANSYLPGGPYENDAEKVNIVEGSNPSDFFYAVDPIYYDALAAQNYNVVLQSNDTVTDDGSLSYFCGIEGKSYVNFEAQAETTSFGQQVVVELDMVYAVRSMLHSRV